MKPANSSKRAKRAKAAAKSAKALQMQRAKKPGGKGPTQPKSAAAAAIRPADVGTIALAKPTMGRQELQAATTVIRDGSLIGNTEVSGFESEFCRLFGLPDGSAVAVNSGTVALYLALWALGAEGKRVALPVYGSSSAKAAIDLARAEACYVDIDKIHIDQAAATATGATFAVVPHTFGLPADISALKNMTVIEDCSDSLGSKVDDKLVGLDGAAAVFSFAAENIITTGGQGGMVMSTDISMIEKIRIYRDALKLTLTEPQAAIGRVQLTKLPTLLERREEIFAHYQGAELGVLDSDDCAISDSAHSVAPARYQAVMRTGSAAAICEFLVSGMIGATIPVSEAAIDATTGGESDKYPNALALSRSTVSLPIYPHLSNAEVGEIIEQVLLAAEHN